MPRKTKEIEEIEELENKKTESTQKIIANTKKETIKSVTKKRTKSKNEAKKSVAKTTTKKSQIKNATKKTKQITNIEYYDLPYRYNQTVIKILSQTPKTLFIYWEISDEDKKNFENQYGKNFFQDTRPVLIIHNKTLNYKFEVEINDFANSWYLHVEDSKCEYQIELGRRPNTKNQKINSDYIYVTTSNQIESSNDKILFDKNQKMVYFRNVKTNIESSKSIKTLSLLKNMGKIYDIYDLYKIIYQNENIEEIYSHTNPSS